MMQLMHARFSEYEYLQNKVAGKRNISQMCKSCSYIKTIEFGAY